MIRKQSPLETRFTKGYGLFTDLESTSNLVSEEDGTFVTIDGGMITQDEVNHAVDRGAGIFIGSYFVGVTESYQCYANSTFGRYS